MTHLDFLKPPARGAPIHPLLLSIYHACPSLRKAIQSSKTSDRTLSHALKTAFDSLDTGEGDSSGVWSLIGASVLLPADAAEQWTQICDLLDSELDHICERALGVQEATNIVARESGQVLEQRVQLMYALPVTVLRDHEALQDLLRAHFSESPIDYAAVGKEDEPILANKQVRLKQPLRETLVIHLQRTRFDFLSMSKSKIYDRVAFEASLDAQVFAAVANDSATAAALARTPLKLMAVVTHNDYDGCTGMFLRDGSWVRACLDGREDEITTLEHVFGGAPGDETALLLFYCVEGGALGPKIAETVRNSIKVPDAANPVRNSIKKADPPLSTGPMKVEVAKDAGGGGCCLMQ